MDISWSWLKAVAPELDGTPHEVAERLAARGAPVEGLTRLGAALDGLVAARVEEVSPHPDADRLSLCRVDAGGGSTVPVVCGAPNVEAGESYAFAPVGSRLPGGMEIGEASIRGQTSRGMLCSARELDLGPDDSGILPVPGEPLPGTGLAEALGLDDWRLDVEVTANRGDLLSHLGVAREVAPGGVHGVTLPPIPGSPELSLRLMAGTDEVTASGVTIRIEEPELCSRYLGAVIRGVEVGPSPPWLQARLRAAGSRPINNVVDATNYVLLEMGQPLHAFDLDRLADATIVVRRPRGDEARFTTLDGESRALDPSMLLICDAREPVAVAGVMGGRDSEVGAGTTDVLLECAWFDPVSIRETRRSLDLSTDASYRFERGVDPAAMARALGRAVEIIVAAAGGEAAPEVADCQPRPWSAHTLTLRPRRVETVLGVEMDAPLLRELLEPLGFQVVGDGEPAEPPGDDPLRVSVPGWRSRDVTREVDLIEEVARAHGYDAFPASLGRYLPSTVPNHPLFDLEDRLRDLLVARGFFEAQTPAFVGKDRGEVAVRNPVSREEGHLRSRVLPSLVDRVEHNWARGARDIRLFELGTSFAPSPPGELPAEAPHLAAIFTGRHTPPHWSGDSRVSDVWDLKGLLQALARALGPDREVVPGEVGDEGLVQGFQVRDASGATVGWGGRLDPADLDAPPWADPAWGLELVLPAEPSPREAPVFHPLPPFPGVERDMALLVPDGVTAEAVGRAIRESAGPHLASVRLFDLYRGPGIPSGTRSLAYRLRFESRERTLTDAEIDEATSTVLRHLRETLDVEPRG